MDALDDVPAFYTLSSSSSSSSSSHDDGPYTPISSPPSTTHDTSRSAYHINDISTFASNLQDAANFAFPNRGRSRYHTINVCLIRWSTDPLNIKPELDALHDVFSSLYGFNAEIWLIPSQSPQIALTSMTCKFLQQHDAEGNLFIVYYGGHGAINPSRQNQWWCDPSPGSPFVDWSAIQTLFASAVSDVLVLLDCCAAASSASSSLAAMPGTGSMETIAACGWETRAPPPGQYSFTHTLIEVLEDWANKPSFSAAMLHTEILFVLKQKRPERGRDGRRLEWCATPIHWVSTVNSRAVGIEICGLRGGEGIRKVQGKEEREQRCTSYIDPMEVDIENHGEETYGSNPLTACRPNGDYKVPHVLISIALEGDQGTLDTAACRRWIQEFPALVKYATVEGVYKGFSTLVTLSVPVMIWDLLPENPACSFIGYVVSPNKHIPDKGSQNSLEAGFVVSKASWKNRKGKGYSSSQNPSASSQDPFISSCDSSYGSEYSPIRSISSRRTEPEFDSDENWEDGISINGEENNPSALEDSTIYDDLPLVTESGPSVTFSRKDIITAEPAIEGASSISNMFRKKTDTSQVSPIDIPTRPKRYSSPDADVLSPRATRRNMLADELTASLIDHLRWERQTRAKLATLHSESLADEDEDKNKEGKQLDSSHSI